MIHATSARKLEKLLLAGTGIVFGSIALVAIVLPHRVAAEYGFVLGTVDAMNEFRAVYTGFWLALAAIYLTAARRSDVPVLGFLGAIALLLQALGRLFSLALDGAPSERFVAAFVLELVAGATLLALRSVKGAEA
jgi:hypothetical protein